MCEPTSAHPPGARPHTWPGQTLGKSKTGQGAQGRAPLTPLDAYGSQVGHALQLRCGT